MRCPYCATDVPPEAIVCPHCTRDFYLFKPLLERIEKLETRLSGQADLSTCEARIAALEQDLAALKAAQTSGTPVPSSGPALTSEADASDSSAAGLKRFWTSLLLAIGPALALLLVAHYALLFAFDVKPLYLRIVTILIPIPFGFALFVWHPQRMRASAIAGFVLAILAVSLMLVTTARIDNVPVIPQSARDLREVLEYMLSIGLAFTTGLLLGKWRYRRLHIAPRPNRLIIFFAELFTTDQQGELGVVRLATRIQKLVTALTPIVTGAASVYAGIKALIGDGS
jgi:hypothetical protein